MRDEQKKGSSWKNKQLEKRTFEILGCKYKYMYTIVSNLVSSVKDYLKTKEYINFKETNNIYIYIC